MCLWNNAERCPKPAQLPVDFPRQFGPANSAPPKRTRQIRTRQIRTRQNEPAKTNLLNTNPSIAQANHILISDSTFRTITTQNSLRR